VQDIAVSRDPVQTPENTATWR